MFKNTFFTEHLKTIAYGMPKIGGNTQEMMLTFCVCVYFFPDFPEFNPQLMALEKTTTE